MGDIENGIEVSDTVNVTLHAERDANDPDVRRAIQQAMWSLRDVYPTKVL